MNQIGLQELQINKSICMRLYSSYVAAGYVVSSEERNKSLEALIDDISLNKGDIQKVLEDNKNNTTTTTTATTKKIHVSAKDIVLRRCGQTDILPFEKCYPNS